MVFPQLIIVGPKKGWMIQDDLGFGAIFQQTSSTVCRLGDIRFEAISQLAK